MLTQNTYRSNISFNLILFQNFQIEIERLPKTNIVKKNKSRSFKCYIEQPQKNKKKSNLRVRYFKRNPEV